jgi:hypothetical protein
MKPKIPLVTTRTGIQIGLMYTPPQHNYMDKLDIFWQKVLLCKGKKNA